MTHGEKEQKCLNMVKKRIFESGGKPCSNPFNGKNYLNIQSDEFAKESVWLTNNDFHKYIFGLLKKDRDEIKYILCTAKANEQSSKFPDFVFENGFIEHFQITSSATTERGGAEHIREFNKFINRVKDETEKTKQDWSNAPSFDELRSKHWLMNNPVHNYQYLKESLKTTWEHHIESMKKYPGRKDIGIFMVQYSDIALCMFENVYKEWLADMSQGDMRKPERLEHYRLSRDKEMLDYIYIYKDSIKYVIFVYCGGIEIIKTENIPYMKKLLPWEYIIKPYSFTLTRNSLYNISMKTNDEEKDLDNE